MPETSSDYIDVETLKAVLQVSTDRQDDALQVAITASSRQIDNWYGDQFWTSGALEDRVLRPDTAVDVRPGVFATSVGLVVKTDEDSDGVFETTWDVSEWQAEASLPLFGYPFDQIIAVGSRFFPAPKYRHSRYCWDTAWGRNYYNDAGVWGGNRRARVQVTAQWGWAAVPAEVTQACQILSIDHWKSKDLTNGSAGIFNGPKMLQQAPFNPLAVKLLCHLKDTILA